MADVVTTFHRLVDLIEPFWPGMRASLHPGATDEELDAVARTIGAWPPELRALLRAHNGQDIRFDIFDLDSLCSVTEITSTWEILIETWPEQRDWVPLTQSDGDGFHVHRATGEVSYAWHPQGLYGCNGLLGPRYASLTALFEECITRIEEGRYKVDDDFELWLGVTRHEELPDADDAD